MRAPVIETARLRLRRWLPRDRAPFAAMNADPAVMDFPRPLTRAESDAEMAGFEARWDADGFCLGGGGAQGATGPSSAWWGSRAARWTLPFCPCVEVGLAAAAGALGAGLRQRGGAGLARRTASRSLGLAEIVAFTDPGHAGRRR